MRRINYKYNRPACRVSASVVSANHIIKIATSQTLCDEDADLLITNLAHQLSEIAVSVARQKDLAGQTIVFVSCYNDTFDQCWDFIRATALAKRSHITKCSFKETQQGKSDFHATQLNQISGLLKGRLATPQLSLDLPDVAPTPTSKPLLSPNKQTG